jgi:hypothetical protein
MARHDLRLCQRLLREHQSHDYITGKRRSTLELGTALADSADAAWPSLKPVTTFKPRIRSEQVTLKRRSFTEAQIAKAKDMAANMFTKNFGTVPMAETVCILETVDKQNVPLWPRCR